MAAENGCSLLCVVSHHWSKSVESWPKGHGSWGVGEHGQDILRCTVFAHSIASFIGKASVKLFHSGWLKELEFISLLCLLSKYIPMNFSLCIQNTILKINKPLTYGHLNICETICIFLGSGFILFSSSFSFIRKAIRFKFAFQKNRGWYRPIVHLQENK